MNFSITMPDLPGESPDDFLEVIKMLLDDISSYYVDPSEQDEFIKNIRVEVDKPRGGFCKFSNDSCLRINWDVDDCSGCSLNPKA